MSKRGAIRFDVMGEYMQGRLNRIKAAELLGVTNRSVTRLATRYRKYGLRGLEHGNRGRSPGVKKSDIWKAKVLRLMKEEYFDFNLSHAKELLEQRHQILVSRETLRRWCHEKGLVGHAKRRRSGVARKLRERMPSCGMMLQCRVPRDRRRCCPT